MPLYALLFPQEDIAQTNPTNWTKKTSTECNIQFTLPPKEVPYYHPYNPEKAPGVKDEGSGSYWQFREGQSQLFLFSHLAVANYSPDGGTGSGYTPGGVNVYCAPNPENLNSKRLLEKLREYLKESKYKVESSNSTTRWNKEVYEISFEGGMFDSKDRYFLLATPSNLYLINKEADSPTEIVQETTETILENLHFVNN